jgi:hypothetical protein
MVTVASATHTLVEEEAALLTAEFSYEFVLNDNKRVTGASVEVKPSKEKLAPRCANASIECDIDAVDIVRLSHGGESKVFWDKHAFGADGDPRILLKGPRDVALIVTCEGQVLVVRSDPTANGRVGLAVYNEGNKVLLVGVGDLVEVDVDNARIPQLVATFHPAYEYMRWSPKMCAHLSGAARKDVKRPK